LAHFLLLRHRVRDFDEWRGKYDAGKPLRDKSGLVELHVLRMDDEPSEVAILFRVESLSQAKKFANSDELKQKMRDAGVVDSPDFFFFFD
jgi:heme-degrading monooxygenase HmoA